MKKTTSATGGAATFQTSTSTTMGHRVQLTPKQVLEKLGNLQMGFYTKMPADAQCIFTISAHVPVKRWMKHPFKQREIRDWDENQVQIKANLIRKFHPEHLMEKVAPVEKWEQMYDYFDAADIWSHGAVNLWLAIDYLYHENKSIEEAKGKGKEIAKGNVAEAYGQQVGDTMDINPPQLANENPEGFMIADDWAYKWLTHADNRQKLSTWDQKRDILSIFTANDWNNVAPCSYEYLDVLRRILIHWHPFYFAPSPVKDSKEGSTASKNEYQAGHGRDVNKYLVPPSSNAVEQLRCSSALATEFPSAVKNSPASSTGSQSANVSPTLRVAPLAIPIVVTAGQGDLKVYGVEHNTRRHEPSKSGPIDMAQTELAKLQTSVEIAGPSRLPAHPLKNSGPSTLPIPSHTAKVACKFHGNRDRSVSQQSEPCHCPRCDKKSRSVLVQGLSIDGIPQEKYTHQIKGFFGKWGEVESCEPTCPKAHPYRLGGRSLRNFFVYFKSDDSAVRACNEAHGQSLYPLANKLKVVFPYHSRHYIELYSPASKQSHVSLRSATQPAEHMTIDKGTGVSGGETQPSQPQQPKTQNQNQKLRTPPMPSVASNQASGGNSSRKPRQPLSGAFVHPAQYSTGSPRHKNRGTSDGRFLENNARFTSSAAFGGNPFGNPSASSQTSPVYVRMQPQQYAQQLYPSGYQQFAGQHQFSGQPQFYGQSQYTQQPQYGSQGFHGMRMPAGVIPGTLFPSAAQPMAHMPQQQYAGHHPAYWNPSQYGAPSYQPCKQDEQQNPAQNAQPARKFQPYGGPQTGYGQVLAHHPSVVPHQYIPVPSGASTTGMLLDMASHVYITPASAAAPAAPGHDQPLPEQKKEHVAEESSILAEMNNSPEVHVSRKQSSTSELSAIPEKPVATETSVAIENPVTTEESVISSQPVASKGHVTPQDCVSSGGATKEITAPEMHTNPIADIPAQEKKGGVSNTAIPVEEETTEAGASVVHQKTIAALPQILEEPESERTKPATERPKYVFGSQDVRFFTSEAEEGKAIETVIHRKLRVRQSIPSEWMGIDNAGSSGVPPISGSAKTPVAPVPTVVERPELRVNTQVGGTDFGTRSRSSAAVLEQNPSPQVAGPKQPQHEDTQEDGKSKPKKNKSKKKKQQQASGQQSGSRPSTLATLVNSPAGGQPENAVQKTGKHGAADTSAENTAAEGTEGKSQKRYRPRKTDLSTSSVQETAHHVSKELPSAPSTLPPKPEQSNLVQQDHDAGSSLWGQDSNAQLASGRGYRADAGGSLRVDRNRNNNNTGG
ncbi:hypothetical protein B0T26DRAFT_282846 [Lasiosphaeria miniovina]|uniref:RRM domain-containing protein n=1 Tax=Lasiosphaeria miniovina TaxID=1954250 RepID=A0AA40AJQ9_9PEZI|nr:uncharacterized protein B0T26DRAFT_282846 [Lasiosphaeria miniovina]KAK0717143.1 hypothetical protein B0T26DRAFT_282846 [Lasiosphaeria miniovina]